ncbi:MAG: hypothetical protein JO015_07430 [Verrucomicrobia bacterium]|nr:hypothetical protein [Verrucomicrobiota bacterium]
MRARRVPPGVGLRGAAPSRSAQAPRATHAQWDCDLSKMPDFVIKRSSIVQVEQASMRVTERAAVRS